MYSIHNIENFDITGKGFEGRAKTIARVCHMMPLKYAEAFIQINYNEHIFLYVSLKSSWRPKWWETLRNRSGYSEHTYNFLGATDITCTDFEENWELLLKALIESTDYTRLAVYHTDNGGFIHGDYKNKYDDAWVYNSKWVKQYQIRR
jgi:hypothetical protein